MTHWADLEAAAPELAGRGRERLVQFGMALAGTTRKDGTARISPVDVHLVSGDLLLAIMPRSHKLGDLRRDPRLVLSAFPHDAGDHRAVEFKLRGRAVELADADARAAAADAIAASGWRPPDAWPIFRLDIEDAAHLEWDRGAMRMTRWTRSRGVEQVERTVELT